MKYIFVLISILIFTSCSMHNVSSEDLLSINTNLKLHQAKEKFASLYSEDEIIERKIEGDFYTVLVLKRVTSIHKTSESRYDNLNQRYRNVSVSNYDFTNFYLVFKGKDYFFAGYGYETEISSKRDILNSIIDRKMETVD